jgi:hypothetical protein
MSLKQQPLSWLWLAGSTKGLFLISAQPTLTPPWGCHLAQMAALVVFSVQNVIRKSQKS